MSHPPPPDGLHLHLVRHQPLPGRPELSTPSSTGRGRVRSISSPQLPDDLPSRAAPGQPAARTGSSWHRITPRGPNVAASHPQSSRRSDEIGRCLSTVRHVPRDRVAARAPEGSAHPSGARAARQIPPRVDALYPRATVVVRASAPRQPCARWRRRRVAPTDITNRSTSRQCPPSPLHLTMAAEIVNSLGVSEISIRAARDGGTDVAMARHPPHVERGESSLAPRPATIQRSRPGIRFTSLSARTRSSTAPSP